MTSLVVVATIWKVLLNEHGHREPTPAVLRHSRPTIGSATRPRRCLAVTITSIWQGFGFETVVFLAALQSIPRELYDAALVDGASGLAAVPAT